MGVDPATNDGGREVRLEGAGLIALAVALCVLLGAAFALGRWSAPEAVPLASGTRDRNSVSDDLPAAPSQGGAGSFFDTAKGPEKAPEPQRQVAATPKPVERAALGSPGESSGPWVVQVFAGRDREAAEFLVRGLTEKGYPVRLESNREGTDLLFRVRVGGYPSQAEASNAADKLRKEGQSGAWVTRQK